MKSVAAFGLAIVAVLALVWIFQRKLIYFPDPGAPSLAMAPAGTEEVLYRTADGLELTAWFVPAATARATVVVFPGNAGNRAARVPLAAALTDRGFSTLLVDYRGYGSNPGSPTEETLVADAAAAVDYLSARSDVDADRLVYFGESLGAGVAVSLARTYPPAALVLRSPFTSLGDVGSHHYPWLPVSMLLRDRYPNVESVRELDISLLVVAGSADEIIPTEHSIAVYEASGASKELVIVEGANHNDFVLLAGDQLLDAVDSFITRALESDQ